MITIEAALTSEWILTDCVLCERGVELTNGWCIVEDNQVIGNLCGLCAEPDTLDRDDLAAAARDAARDDL